jgi:hypothetical protein
MSEVSATNVILAALGVGGVSAALWQHHKLSAERKIRETLEVELARQQTLQLQGAMEALPKALPPGPAPASPPRNAGSGPPVASLTPAPRMYDDVFAACGQGLPVPFLRALALRESDMSPRLCSGPAWGLLQVIEVVRADFNQRAGTRYTRQDLLDPAINVTIAATTIALIVKSYAIHHPDAANLRTDWRNPQFAALVAFGWNAGWSERAGVGRVATYLEQRGITVDINNVHRYSCEAGASKHLANPRKLAFAKSIAKQYFRELAEDGKPELEPREIDMSGDDGGHPVVAVEPVHVEPVYVEPVYVEPVHVEPVYVEPVHEPVYVEPVHAPVHVEPVHVEPVYVEPVHIEPVHVEPVYAEPGHVEPVYAEHGPPSQLEHPPHEHPIAIIADPAPTSAPPAGPSGPSGWPVDPYGGADSTPPHTMHPSGGSGPVNPYGCPTGAPHA